MTNAEQFFLGRNPPEKADPHQNDEKQGKSKNSGKSNK
jgi:hypothetical protein